MIFDFLHFPFVMITMNSLRFDVFRKLLVVAENAVQLIDWDILRYKL